jgi:hypothetical protein
MTEQGKIIAMAHYLAKKERRLRISGELNASTGYGANPTSLSQRVGTISMSTKRS